jgi:hypothetical protein
MSFIGEKKIIKRKEKFENLVDTTYTITVVVVEVDFVDDVVHW